MSAASTSQQGDGQPVPQQQAGGSSSTPFGIPQQVNGASSTNTNANASTSDIEMNGQAQETKPQADSDQGPSDETQQDKTEEELNRIFSARREEEMARRDRSLAEFLVMLDGYKPLVRNHTGSTGL